MVKEAKKVTPPNGGDEYLFGFANLQRDIAFAIKVEQGIKANAKAAGLELAVADNQLSGQVALQNAQSFVTRNMDYAIEFQTDVEFGPQVMQQFNQANIPVIAIDIPMPGAIFFGVNNPRSGFMGGSYLAQAALAKWGDEVQNGYFVIGELPQSGAIPALRTAGQREGFLASAEGFPEDQIIGIDTKNTLEESFQQMSNVLGRIPKGVPIIVTAINDQSATGMLRAIERAGRSEDALVVGLGADEIKTLVNEEKFIASVGSFPERYGNYIIPLALMQLAGYEVPDAVLVKHEMVTPMNVCDYYDQDC
ncbi:MAG: substrate-binding domain-containing protein, partial [Pyrinomonadaceae bacterium]|nr:substrate-binding domain-containing protein [Pyrinomonadaceae bacterium]